MPELAWFDGLDPAAAVSTAATERTQAVHAAAIKYFAIRFGSPRRKPPFGVDPPEKLTPALNRHADSFLGGTPHGPARPET
jgi:hypothetical protein